jgi:hypothetical protein
VFRGLGARRGVRLLRRSTTGGEARSRSRSHLLHLAARTAAPNRQGCRAIPCARPLPRRFILSARARVWHRSSHLGVASRCRGGRHRQGLWPHPRARRRRLVHAAPGNAGAAHHGRAVRPATDLVGTLSRPCADPSLFLAAEPPARALGLHTRLYRQRAPARLARLHCANEPASADVALDRAVN